MIVDGYPLFEDDQPEAQVEKLSERVQKWLGKKRLWRDNLAVRLEELRKRHADPSRTEHQVLRFAWVDLLRDFVSPSDRRLLVAALREVDLRVQNSGGPEAYEDQLAQSRGKSALRAARKAELAQAAGHSQDVRACVQWAMRWEPVVRGRGRKQDVVRWELVGDVPPGPAALSYLEQAIADQQAFYSQIVPKFMAKADEEDGVRRYEERAIAGILDMLHEVQREIAEKGEEAYV
jgi:hypothetical protein